MKRIKHLILLLFFASLSIPTLAQYVPETMEIDSDSVVVDSIEEIEMDFEVSLDSLRLLVENNPQDAQALLYLPQRLFFCYLLSKIYPKYQKYYQHHASP